MLRVFHPLSSCCFALNDKAMQEKTPCCSLEFILFMLQPLWREWCQKSTTLVLWGLFPLACFCLSCICCPLPAFQSSWINSQPMGNLDKCFDFKEPQWVWRHFSAALKWNEWCKCLRTQPTDAKASVIWTLALVWHAFLWMCTYFLV